MPSASLFIQNSFEAEFDDPKSINKNTVILIWERKYKGIDNTLLNAANIIESPLNKWIWNLPIENRKIIEQSFLESVLSFNSN